MGLKPPKKSDLKKSWMTARRDKTVKINPEYHLIVSEGTDTEPAYFQSFKEIINLQYREHIHLDIFGEGDNTISLFNRAKSRAEASPNGYKHVWVVYDTDDFPADNIDRVPLLCQRATTEETIYHAVWSNQCIELWFLLHFSYFHSDLHRKEYWPKLSEQLQIIGQGNYKKNRRDIYDVLAPYMETAIANGKRLDENNRGLPPSKATPGTKIYELVDMLKPYLK